MASLTDPFLFSTRQAVNLPEAEKAGAGVVYFASSNGSMTVNPRKVEEFNDSIDTTDELVRSSCADAR